MSQQGSPFATQTIFANPEQKPSGGNGMGVAGFVCSLLGLLTSCCTCAFPILGLLSLVGLVLSFIAVFRRPKGFAITGIILGAIGLLITVFGLLASAAFAGAGGALQVIKAMGTGQAVSQYRTQTGSYPADLSAVTKEFPAEMMKDKWGNEFVYEVSQDGSKFTIRSKGADGQDHTSDDVTFKKEWFQDQGFTPEPIPQLPPIPDAPAEPEGAPNQPGPG